jgi:glycosyltransferase involved in cell wall biosynthesis
MHVDPGDVTPHEQLDRWPTTARTLRALSATGACRVAAVLRTREIDTSFERDDVRYLFVRDRSRSSRRIAAAVVALRPDVVHVNGLVAAVDTIVLAIRLRAARLRRVRPGEVGQGKVRLVVQHHGEPPGETRRLRTVQRLARRAVDTYLFTGGRAQAEPWISKGIFRTQTRVVDVLESAADLQPSPVSAAVSVTSGSPAVIWVGRLNPGKDPLTAIRAFAAAARSESMRGATLNLLYTDPADEAKVRAELGRHHGLAERVTLVGAVAHTEMASWFTSSDLILSTSHHEGSGYALLEALSCGCVPVVTDLPSHATIAGPWGTRFAPGDASGAEGALVVAAARWGADPAIRARIARDAVVRLSWKAVAGQLLDAYGLEQGP